MTNQNFIAKGGLQWRNISCHNKFYSKSDSTPLFFVSLPTLSLFPSLTRFSLFPSLTRFPHQKNFNRRARLFHRYHQRRRHHQRYRQRRRFHRRAHRPRNRRHLSSPTQESMSPSPFAWLFTFHLTVCLLRLPLDHSPSTWLCAFHLTVHLPPIAVDLAFSLTVHLPPDHSPPTWPFTSHLSPSISLLASSSISLSIDSRAARRHRH